MVSSPLADCPAVRRAVSSSSSSSSSSATSASVSSSATSASVSSSATSASASSASSRTRRTHAHAMPPKKAGKKASPDALALAEQEAAAQAARDAQFLSVAASLLQNNDASFDALRREVLSLRQRHLAHKREIAAERAELVQSREHLKHNLDLTEARAAQAEAAAAQLEASRAQLEADARRAAEDARQTSAEEVKAVRLALEALQDETATLLEFKEKKAAHDKALEALREETNQMRLAYEERLRQKDADLQEQTEHLIQRLNHEVRRTRDEMTSKMRNELDATTKQTMEENLRLTTELQFQSHRIGKLVGENGKLTARNKKLGRELSTHRDMALQNAKRIRFYARLFQRLQVEEEERKRLEAARDAARVEHAAGLPPMARGGVGGGGGGDDDDDDDDDDARMRQHYSQIDRQLDKLLGAGSLQGSADLARATDELTKRLSRRLAEDMQSVEDIREQNSLYESGGSGSVGSKGGGRPGRKLVAARPGARAGPAPPGGGASSSVSRGGSGGPQKGTWSFPQFNPDSV